MWKNFGKFRKKVFKDLEDSISLLLDNLGEESPPQGPDLNNIEHLWIYLIRNKKSIKTTSGYNFVSSGEFIARICHAFFAIFLQLLSSVLR
jgi:transposase